MPVRPGASNMNRRNRRPRWSRSSWLPSRITVAEAYKAFLELPGGWGWVVAGIAVVSAAMTFAYSFRILYGAFAQQGTSTPPSGTAPQAQPGQGQSGQGMMGGIMGMMNMMGQMDPAQMSRVMENCNEMMEGMNRAPDGSGPSPSAPAPNPRRG